MNTLNSLSRKYRAVHSPVFWIAAHGTSDDEPVMPDIPAQIKGFTDIQKHTVAWEAKITYTTRQGPPANTAPIPLSDVFTFSKAGGQFPSSSEIFVKDSNTVVMGGKLILTAKIRVDGKWVTGISKEIQILAKNPEVAKADAWLVMDGMTLTIPAVDATSSDTTMQIPACTLTDWIRAIARQESEGTMWQFIGTGERLDKFSVVGEPRMNHGGDGGMGMMQITNNITLGTGSLPDVARFQVLWDWTNNVGRGIKTFREKIAIAQNFSNAVRTSFWFTNALTETNTYRHLYLNEPILDAIYVTDLTMEELVEDAVRGYNGYGKWEGSFFELYEHEWRLHNGYNPFAEFPYLYTEHERVLPDGRRVADAIWERVPWQERSTISRRDYVNQVRRKKQDTCP